MDYYFSIAGITLCVKMSQGELHDITRLLDKYKASPCQADKTLEFRCVDVISEPIGECVFRDAGKIVFADGEREVRYIGAVANGPMNAWMRIDRQGDHSFVEIKSTSIPNGISSKTVANAMEAEHIIVEDGGILLHASYISTDDGAILFTAPSGVGKSTQARLWCELRGAKLMNGDRAAVKYENESVFAYGIPFSGSSGVSENETMPVRAIVYLSQAPVTQITRLTGVRAFRRVWEGCSVNSWNRTDVEKCASTVGAIVSAVPIFHLSCTPDESAILALEEQLGKGN